MHDHRFKLLVVDDDDLILHAIRLTLPATWTMLGLNSLSEPESIQFDAAIVDMHLTDSSRPDGGKVIAKISEAHPNAEIVAMSGDLSRETMELGLKAGATRFIGKPLSAEELHLTLTKIEALLRLRSAATRSPSQTKSWIGFGEASQKLQRQVANLLGETTPILIEGPSGVGKEIVANLINKQEPQKNRPFVAINVAAIPDNLFESEVFGHTKGAFTGAEKSKVGLIEAANGGDLFLDEIEALPENQQAKLLRFLENGEVRKVGSKENIHIDCRVIAATNRSLEEMVVAGEFREDLLWRLNGQKISVPKLKDRKEDIPLLAKYFTDTQKPRRNKQWTDDGLKVLQDYNWPGNVRELKRVCEQVGLRSPLPIIRAEDVRAVLSVPTSSKDNSQVNVCLEQGLARLMADYEAILIKTSLNREKDIDATAKLLQISRSSLYKKIKDHRIEL